MFWAVMLLVAAVPCAAFAALSAFPRTAPAAIWLWRLGIIAFGWVSGTIIRSGVDAPADTDDMQNRISFAMAIRNESMRGILAVLSEKKSSGDGGR